MPSRYTTLQDMFANAFQACETAKTFTDSVLEVSPGGSELEIRDQSGGLKAAVLLDLTARLALTAGLLPCIPAPAMVFLKAGPEHPAGSCLARLYDAGNNLVGQFVMAPDQVAIAADSLARAMQD